ncbi:Uncharacterized protein TCM_037783 [Theobroma cacao]|uniref:Uncharacterized protein n=1 Tax=Theobroma cacao TaxID=3641 RepID=A0A061GMQ3_THECC|nr:Uncharacterized protein TCM_037783 [Theobroma cacao]
MPKFNWKSRGQRGWKIIQLVTTINLQQQKGISGTGVVIVLLGALDGIFGKKCSRFLSQSGSSLDEPALTDRGGKPSWFQGTLNKSRLDNYFPTLAAMVFSQPCFLHFPWDFVSSAGVHQSQFIWF